MSTLRKGVILGLIGLVLLAAVGDVRAGRGVHLYCMADRVCYSPGQEAEFTVKLTNFSKSKVRGTLRFEVVSELDNTDLIGTRDVNVEAGEKAEFSMTWQVPAGSKWGHAARAIMLDENGVELAQRNGFFTTGEHPWQVGHWSSWCSLGETTKEDIKLKCVGTLKRWLCTAADYFSWQESGWETLVPTTDKWATGQTHNPESTESLKYFIDLCHEQGMEVYSYLQGASWGFGGLEWIRAHPEFWNYDRFGRPFPGKFVYNVDYLEKLGQGERGNKYHMALWAHTGAMWNDEIKQYLFDQLKGSVELFGWDGFRSDGLPFPANVWDYTGKYHEVVSEDKDVVLIKWFQELRDVLHAIDPDCSLHFNAGAVAYPAGRNSRKRMQAKAVDSMALWESGHGVERPGWDLTNIDTYINYLHQEVAVAREVGGYRHVGYTSYGTEVVEAATTACGGKVSLSVYRSQYKRGPHSWRAFTFRFGRYFWDPDIVHVPNAASFIQVDCGPKTRWQDLVQKRTEADGRSFYMTHLINLAEPYKVKVKQPKPPSEHDVRVTFSGPDSSRVERVLALTCDNGVDRMCTLLPHESKGNIVTATLPELKVWSVIVFELGDARQ